MRYITIDFAPEAIAHGCLSMFIGLWSERISDYDVRIDSSKVWGQIIQSQKGMDHQLIEAAAELELILAEHPETKDLDVDISVLPFFIPKEDDEDN